MIRRIEDGIESRVVATKKVSPEPPDGADTTFDTRWQVLYEAVDLLFKPEKSETEQFDDPSAPP
jgi:hypothetical protein